MLQYIIVVNDNSKAPLMQLFINFKGQVTPAVGKLLEEMFKPTQQS